MLNLAVIMYYSINYTVVGGGRMFNDLRWLITCYYVVYTALSRCPSHCQFGKIRGVLIHKICSTHWHSFNVFNWYESTVHKT